jgi:hypothetical protein
MITAFRPGFVVVALGLLIDFGEGPCCHPARDGCVVRSCSAGRFVGRAKEADAPWPSRRRHRWGVGA